MLHSNLTAKSVELSLTKSVPLCEVTERVRHGEVIVIPGCMQALGYFEQLKEAGLEGIRQVVGLDKAARVREEGFESIHTIVDIDEIAEIVNSGYEVFRLLAPALSKVLAQEVFQTKKPFYFEEYPNVRFHIPYDVVIRKLEEFSKFRWNGKVTAHGPHHDSWYYCPTNCINVWIAIGSVKIGNGLSLYPDVYGKRLPCTKDGKIVRDQHFGRAINFELKPGDVIIFHGEHLHASEINSTDMTRFVASFRMTLDKPRFLGQSPYKYDYVYSESNNGLAAAFKQFLANTSRRLAKRINLFFNKPETSSYIISPSEIQVFDDTSADFPKFQPIKDVEGEHQDKSNLVFNASDLKIGTIKPLSQKLCIARLDEHHVVVFSRYCSHEGADLAAGYLRDGCVVCPWHNLPFSLENGTSPCKSLPRLTVCDLVESSGKDEWQAAIGVKKILITDW